MLSASITGGNGTYLHHLDAGDSTSPQYMILEELDQIKIDSLQIHGFLFILRSYGQWIYAIIARREENNILFVVDTTVSTKEF